MSGVDGRPADLDGHRAQQVILTDAEPRIERDHLELVVDGDVHPFAVMRRQTGRTRRDASIREHGEDEGAVDLDVRARLVLALRTDNALQIRSVVTSVPTHVGQRGSIVGAVGHREAALAVRPRRLRPRWRRLAVRRLRARGSHSRRKVGLARIVGERRRSALARTRRQATSARWRHPLRVVRARRRCRIVGA